MAGRLEIAVNPTPEGLNPYVGPGLAGVPRVLERCAPSTGRLAGVVREAEFLRGMGAEEVSRKSGASLEAVRKLEEEGTGNLEDIFAVLDALSVRAVELPPLSDLAEPGARP